ncbi:MAG: hypothetical protein ACOCRX_06255 [Candidatus Woesearchaeota archaeon]
MVNKKNNNKSKIDRLYEGVMKEESSDEKAAEKEFMEVLAKHKAALKRYAKKFSDEDPEYWVKVKDITIDYERGDRKANITTTVKVSDAYVDKEDTLFQDEDPLTRLAEFDEKNLVRLTQNLKYWEPYNISNGWTDFHNAWTRADTTDGIDFGSFLKRKED